MTTIMYICVLMIETIYSFFFEISSIVTKLPKNRERDREKVKEVSTISFIDKSYKFHILDELISMFEAKR